MKSDLSVTWVWATVIVLSAGVCWASPRATDPYWTCPQSPQACVSSAGLTNECAVDGNCAAGERCCFRGCIKRCELPDPCDNVICESGFTCLSEETACGSPPCQLEAVCKPDSNVQANCNSPTCATDPCDPGYEHETDADGCPTCTCRRIPGCSISLCNPFCPLGVQTDAQGCPTCTCNEAATDPCDAMDCSGGGLGGLLNNVLNLKECRLVQQDCGSTPCEPTAQCLDGNLLTLGNQACNSYDASTLGNPLYDSSGQNEIDCSNDPCPDNTVCVDINGDNKCCWQATQQTVTVPPKEGECPQEYMIDFTAVSAQCTIDAECPGDEKCCYRRLDLNPPNSYGLCMKPVHNVIQDATSECNRSLYLRMVFAFYGHC